MVTHADVVRVQIKSHNEMDETQLMQEAEQYSHSSFAAPGATAAVDYQSFSEHQINAVGDFIVLLIPHFILGLCSPYNLVPQHPRLLMNNQQALLCLQSLILLFRCSNNNSSSSSND